MTFRHSKRWYFYAKIIAKVLGVLFAFVPAVVAVLCNFPIMVTKNSESTVSMLFIAGVLIASVALLYFVAKTVKKNPFLLIIASLTIITVILIGVYFMEKDTILGLAWVAGSATCGCVLSCVCFSLNKMWDDLYKNCGEIYGKVESK